MEFLLKLFDPTGFPPRWKCGVWSAELGWLHILSDLGVWSAYMAIPITLAYFVSKKKDLPFRRIFMLFTAFILACGSTHLLEAVIFWWPAYRLAGLFKLTTAIISWVTVGALIQVLPKMLSMRTPHELQREVDARKRAEEELMAINVDLANRISAKTAKLRAANELLAAERERFLVTLESIGDAVIATDADGRVTFLNRIAEEQTGWDRQSAYGELLTTIFPIFDETTRSPVANPATKALSEGKTVGLANHTVLVSKNGSEHPIDDCASPIRDAEGRIIGAVLVFRDVTEKRRAEDALKTSEARFRAFMGNMPAGAWVLDRQSKCVFVNRFYGTMAGIDETSLVGKTAFDLYPAEIAEQHQLNDREVLGSQVPLETVETYVRADGSVGELLVVKFPMVEGSGAELIGGVAIEITERKKVEQALLQSEERLRLALSAGQMGTFDWEIQSNHVVWSQSHYQIFNYDQDTLKEVSLKHFEDRVHPEDRQLVRDAVQRSMTDKTNYSLEYRLLLPDQSVRWISGVGQFSFDENGTPIRMVGIVSDITKRKSDELALRATEERLRQSQKLEAIGQLAGGIAHDFNNLLTVVNGCGELLLSVVPEPSEQHELTTEIIAAGRRGAALTHQLLAFSRQQVLNVEVFDLRQVISGTVSMLRRLLTENIEVDVQLANEDCTIKTDIGQIEQVILNLAVNARDAMPQGGKLTIKASNLEMTPDRIKDLPDASVGNYVCLSVADTGSGMNPDVKLRMFEPFFTTKPVGKGTGLGLSTVYGIVRQSGGFMSVESELGQGTVIQIYLPAEQAVATPLQNQSTAGPLTGHEFVLVVEDDPAVRALAVQILKRQGYRLEAAENGAAALSLCEQLPQPPDVVLTDVIMPGMSGRELGEILLARYPHIRIGYLSGYTADEMFRQGIEENRVSFLSKPYTLESLTTFVRQILEVRSRPHTSTK